MNTASYIANLKPGVSLVEAANAGTSEGVKKSWAKRPKGKYFPMISEFWKCPHCKEKIHESKLNEPQDQAVWDAGFSECPNCKGTLHPDKDALEK